MSAHYDKCGLNTYRAGPYFQAHIPPDYPLGKVMMKCRAFRRLPPRLRELSELSKRWTQRVYPPSPFEGIEKWYDEEGYELNPSTGERLTDEEIDAEWDRYHPNLGLDDFTVEDIPLPDGGFADPDTWEEPLAPTEPNLDDETITKEQLLKDIRGYGREYVAKDAGVPAGLLSRVKSDEELAQMIRDRIDGKPWPVDPATVRPADEE
jgi:hypothetical protein